MRLRREYNRGCIDRPPVRFLQYADEGIDVRRAQIPADLYLRNRRVGDYPSACSSQRYSSREFCWRGRAQPKHLPAWRGIVITAMIWYGLALASPQGLRTCEVAWWIVVKRHVAQAVPSRQGRGFQYRGGRDPRIRAQIIVCPRKEGDHGR